MELPKSTLHTLTLEVASGSREEIFAADNGRSKGGAHSMFQRSKDSAGVAVAAPTVDRYLARQPIFDRQGSVLGYELLFRSGLDNFFKPQDASIPSEILIDRFLLFGLETLTGARRAFINFTRDDLVRGYPSLFPSDRIVVEILEGTSPDAEVVSACRTLKQNGYLIALDDYSLAKQGESLLPFADIVKVDFLATPQSEKETLVRRLALNGIKLLAEKVETHESVATARDLGFNLFQGYFYCRPQILSALELRGFKPHYLRMLQAVNRPEMNLRDIEEILKREPSLLYKLLRYLNSAYFGLRSEITSIRHALALLGEDKLRKWASVAALVQLAQDKPAELIVTSLVRARFCESLADPLCLKPRETDLFLLGLLSVMDAVLGREMSDVIREVSLAEEVKMALLNQECRFRHILDLVLAFEMGAWRDVEAGACRLRLDESVISSAYLQSVEWTARIFQK